MTPESSDTYTLGAVYTPSFLPGFSASIDYFDISIDDAIVAGSGAQNLLDACLGTGDPFSCNLITRDAAGSLNASTPDNGFELLNINAASIETQGLDLQANYVHELGTAGDLSFRYASTILFQDDFLPVDGAPLSECEGAFIGTCGQPAAEYRHSAVLGWGTPVAVSYTHLTLPTKA